MNTGYYSGKRAAHQLWHQLCNKQAEQAKQQRTLKDAMKMAAFRKVVENLKERKYSADTDYYAKRHITEQAKQLLELRKIRKQNHSIAQNALTQRVTPSNKIQEIKTQYQIWKRDKQNGKMYGKYLVKCITDYDKSYPYSKQWHRKYGPTVHKTTSIFVSTWDTRNKRVVQRCYPQKAKLQDMTNAEISAVALFARMKPRKGHKGLRINEFVDLTPVKGQRYKVWKRTFCGKFLGFVAKRKNVHFHASSIISAITGLREKVQQSMLMKFRPVAKDIQDLHNKTIYRLLKQFGFCHEGIMDALNIMNLEYNRTYTVNSLMNSAQWENFSDVSEKYPEEIKTIQKYIKQFQGYEEVEKIQQLIAG